jgi:hypothetical protein
MIYRSWRVDAMRSLRLPTSWPHELVTTIAGVTIVENEMM